MHNEIYNKQLIQAKVEVPFEKYLIVWNHILKNVRKHIMGKCSKEGYIGYNESGNNVKVHSYTSGLLDRA